MRATNLTNHHFNGDVNRSEEPNHHAPLRLHSLVFNVTHTELSCHFHPNSTTRPTNSHRSLNIYIYRFTIKEIDTFNVILDYYIDICHVTKGSHRTFLTSSYKTNGEVNISHENTTVVVWICGGV